MADTENTAETEQAAEPAKTDSLACRLAGAVRRAEEAVRGTSEISLDPSMTNMEIKMQCLRDIHAAATQGKNDGQSR